MSSRVIASGSFSYDGLDATHHTMPARDIGPALIGLDTIVSSLIVLLETGKVQRKRPSHPKFILSVSEFKAGSLDLPWLAQVAPALLPLLPHFVQALQSNLIEHFVNYVMMWHGGRRKEADKKMEKMLDLLGDNLRLSHEDRQRERDHMRAMLDSQAGHLLTAAKSSVFPIGRSATLFKTRKGSEFGNDAIDEATADAIRDSRELEVSDILDMTLVVEGLREQKRTMYVYDPEDLDEVRTFSVIIADPTFDHTDNAYRQAFFSRSAITLTGRTTRGPDGRIKAFHAISATL